MVLQRMALGEGREWENNRPQDDVFTSAPSNGEFYLDRSGHHGGRYFIPNADRFVTTILEVIFE